MIIRPGKDIETERVKRMIQQLKNEMSSGDIANNLIKAFEGYSKEDIIKLTQEYDSLSKILKNKFGKDIYYQMTRQDSSKWQITWALFEGRYEIRGLQE
jgi:hypothetical protein